MKLHWLAQTDSDLAQVAGHVATDNPIAADALERRIITLACNLVRFPDAGRPGRVVRTRELIVPEHPYIIVYQARKDDILVLRILHASRQWPTAD